MEQTQGSNVLAEDSEGSMDNSCLGELPPRWFRRYIRLAAHRRHQTMGCNVIPPMPATPGPRSPSCLSNTGARPSSYSASPNVLPHGRPTVTSYDASSMVLLIRRSTSSFWSTLGAALPPIVPHCARKPPVPPFLPWCLPWCSPMAAPSCAWSVAHAHGFSGRCLRSVGLSDVWQTISGEER